MRGINRRILVTVGALGALVTGGFAATTTYVNRNGKAGCEQVPVPAGVARFTDYKVEGNPISGLSQYGQSRTVTLTSAGGNTMQVTFVRRTSVAFGWSATREVGAVIVKWSSKATVEIYDPFQYRDDYIGTDGIHGISHVVFCVPAYLASTTTRPATTTTTARPATTTTTTRPPTTTTTMAAVTSTTRPPTTTTTVPTTTTTVPRTTTTRLGP